MSKEPKSFLTSTGITIKVHGIPQMLLDKIQSSVDRPEPPKYKIVTASGEEIWEPHTLDTLETDEDKKIYNDYLKQLAAVDAIVNERMFRVIAMKGVEVEMPDDNAWVEMQKFLGVRIPDDPLELKYLYVQTEVIGNTDDIMEITELVMQETGVSEEALAEARKSFPGGVQKKPKSPGNGRSRKRQVVE